MQCPILFVAVLHLAIGSAAIAAPLVGERLTVVTPFSFADKDVRRAVSGIACRKVGARHRCLVAFDEGMKVQFAELEAKRMKAIGAPIALMPDDGELDAEGAAIDGRYVYVAGSHSVKRKTCAPNLASRQVVRMNLSGRAAVERSTKLWDVIREHPMLKQHAGGCLGADSDQAGINIEGIAARSGQLYFGFRGPSVGGVVPMLSVSAASLFSNAVPAPRVIRLRVGDGLGIRDMVATQTAMLLLIGPDDHDPASAPRWLLAEWKEDPGAIEPLQPKVLAELEIGRLPADGCSKDVKPEAMALLSQTAAHYRVLLLSDGLCDGGPQVFGIPR